MVPFEAGGDSDIGGGDNSDSRAAIGELGGGDSRTAIGELEVLAGAKRAARSNSTRSTPAFERSGLAATVRQRSRSW
jgi:hypothetical protein